MHTRADRNTQPSLSYLRLDTWQLAHRTWWRYLIVDEGHVLKNDETQISQALKKYHYTHCLLLTGTPLQVLAHACTYAHTHVVWRRRTRACIDRHNVT